MQPFGICPPSIIYEDTAEQETYKMNSYFLVGQARALCPSSRQIPQRLGLLERGTLGSSVGVVVKLVLADKTPVSSGTGNT